MAKTLHEGRDSTRTTAVLMAGCSKMQHSGPKGISGSIDDVRAAFACAAVAYFAANSTVQGSNMLNAGKSEKTKHAPCGAEATGRRGIFQDQGCSHAISASCRIDCHRQPVTS